MRFVSVALCGLFTVSAVAQVAAVSARERVGFESISAKTMRSDLEFFAGDGTEGRMTLSAGDMAASEWIAAEFEKAGLKPLAMRDGKHSYLQPVPVVEYAGDSKATEVTFEKDGKREVLHAPQVSGGFRDPVDVKGGLVYVGYGITAPELHYDDYAGVDVRGKVALMMEYEPQEDDPHSAFNGTGLTRHGTLRVKLINAQAHGAVAVIVIPEPNSTHPTTATRMARVFVGVTGKRLTPIASQQLAEDEVHIPLFSTSAAMAEKLIGTSPSELQRSIDGDLKPRSFDVKATVHLQTRNLYRKTGTTYNVVGLLEGSDPKLKAETVIVAAHHDHNGISEVQEPDGSKHIDIWRGADDNGSGAVGVVALAHAFAKNPVKPKRSVMFVVFASEERGFEGSYWMTQHPLRDLKTTRAFVNFDMIGRDEKPSAQTDGQIEIPANTANRLNLIGQLYSPELKQVVVREDKHVGLELDDRFDKDTTLGLFYRSDQFTFVLHGVPAVWFFTGFHPDYHHATDTVEKIDFAKMEKIVRLGYLTLFEVGDAAVTPKLLAGAAATE